VLKEGLALVGIRVTAWIAAIAGFVPAGALATAITTYDFTVTYTTGGLGGQLSSGYFSFDSSIVPPSGTGRTTSVPHILDFHFVHNGTVFHEENAGTDRAFDFVSGRLVSFFFGGDLPDGDEVWSMTSGSDDFFLSQGGISYVAIGKSSGNGVVVFSPRATDVPEPGTIELLGVALAGAALVRRRPKRPSPNGYSSSLIARVGCCDGSQSRWTEMKRRNVLAAAVGLSTIVASTGVGATILTFDVSGGVNDFQNIPQNYGDNVAGSPQAGHSYRVGPEGFTQNIIVAYGAPGEQPRLWTTGFGNLANVHFNDADFDTTFTLRMIADAGFDVRLFGLDLASFLDSGQTIRGLTVRDGDGATLHSQGMTFVPGAAHLSVDFATPLQAQILELVIDLTGLAGDSDEIGIDNVRFGQVADAPPNSIPEPSTLVLLGAGLAMLTAMRRKKV
jgi:hypothetical protein